MVRRKISRLALIGFALNVTALPWCDWSFAADVSPPRTLTVSGDGEAKAVPDEAQLSAGVVTQAKRAADALAANTRAMNEVFATLKRFGIPEKDMQTSQFSVEPQYAADHNGNATSRVTGYSVSNTVNVTVDIAKLGQALDALVASGANSIGSIAFTIRDPKPLLAKARADAIRDATERAQTFARAAGFALGPILTVNEGGATTPQPVFAARMMAAAPMAPPVAAGESSVTANVSVTFAIR
ncbi:MAG TPA: SIMPL domain-containing protein [Rhizomicrobium sp.]|nr:SIMPL domain-containing protein [Rhizomicrobium sp.]